MAILRPVERTITAHRQQEGAGFIVRRPLPSMSIEQLDPFLLIDELGPVDYAPREAVGAPDHPHRGFETVSYILEGEVEHEDSAGHRGALGPGDVQWMTAGRGIVHSELPSRRLRQDGGRMHGFQIWVNLPARLKMTEPRYQEVPRRSIPEARSADGLASVRVVAGAALGATAVIETHTPISFHDWTLRPGGDVTTPIESSHNVGVYVFSGAAIVCGARLVSGQLAVLGPGDTVGLSVAADATEPARLLLLSGQPIGEPMVRYGPFVMNTTDELRQAFEDHRTGRLGRIRR